VIEKHQHTPAEHFAQRAEIEERARTTDYVKEAIEHSRLERQREVEAVAERARAWKAKNADTTSNGAYLLLKVFLVACAIGIPIGLLYAVVRVIHWMWETPMGG
jgi:hypothetical protein